VNTPDNDAKPTVDEQTQQRLEQRSRQAEEAVKQTKKQLEAADKQVSRARQAAQKTQTQYAEITRKITAIVQGLAGNQQDSSEPQTYKPFTILGAVFLVLAVVILIFARTSLWVLVALAAVVQLGMGFMLRTRSQ
jgi:predicted RND superfamily exporter protein